MLHRFAQVIYGLELTDNIRNLIAFLGIYQQLFQAGQAQDHNLRKPATLDNIASIVLYYIVKNLTKVVLRFC